MTVVALLLGGVDANRHRKLPIPSLYSHLARHLLAVGKTGDREGLDRKSVV